MIVSELSCLLLNGVMFWLLVEESCKCNGGSLLDCCDKHKVSNGQLEIIQKHVVEI